MPRRICGRLRNGSCASLPRASIRGASGARAIAGELKGTTVPDLWLCAARRAQMARILLAEDDAATRDLVHRALSTDGHSVTSTQDGTDALDKLREGPGNFDLLVTDVQMPG